MRQYLIDHGIDSSRLEAKGMGYKDPIADDKGCVGPDEKLTPSCREATSKNRRVAFLILKLGAPPPRPIAEGAPGSAAVLPTGQQQIPSGNNVLSTCTKGGSSTSGCLLPSQEGVLKKDTVLGKPNTILPSEPILKSGGSILPKGGSTLPQR